MSMNPQKEQLTGRRVRRNYPQEFRREAVGMIEREGMTTTDSNHSQSVAENIMDRDFAAKKRGKKLVSDLTYVATDEVL